MSEPCPSTQQAPIMVFTRRRRRTTDPLKQWYAIFFFFFEGLFLGTYLGGDAADHWDGVEERERERERERETWVRRMAIQELCVSTVVAIPRIVISPELPLTMIGVILVCFSEMSKVQLQCSPAVVPTSSLLAFLSEGHQLQEDRCQASRQRCRTWSLPETGRSEWSCVRSEDELTQFVFLEKATCLFFLR